MNVAVTPVVASPLAGKQIRVMIVDDAVVVRGILTRWIETESDMHVVASLRNGREAVEQLEKIDPDVVILDIDMPELDGLSALPLLLAKRRHLVVIMASTLTRRNAEISLKALSLGAKDYIAKPESTGEVVGSLDFHRDLVEKIRHLSARARNWKIAHQARQSGAAGYQPGATPGTMQSPPLAPDMPVASALRPFPATVPRVLVIGASTGGPQALTGVLAQLGGLIDRSPVLITQHMPPTFTAILAEHLEQASGRPAHEARDGEEINAGTIYLAPGGRHMTVERRDGLAVIALSDGAPVNFCKPAVDPLFSSAAKVWSHCVSSLVLTGMGSDGLRGAREIVAAGGSVMAQDEATSVVWGMPGQVANAGICSAVLPLKDIAPRLMRLFAAERP